MEIVQIIIAFVFGVAFVITLILLSIRYPQPTPFQEWVFRIVLALAAAGVAAMIPGFINIDVKPMAGLLIRASGAIAVFVIVLFFNPTKPPSQRKNKNQINEYGPSYEGKKTFSDKTSEIQFRAVNVQTDLKTEKVDGTFYETNIEKEFEIRFKDAFYPSVVNLKSLVQLHESSKNIIVKIDWPKDQNDLLRFAEKLMVDAEVYDNPESYFFGFSEQEVVEWLNIGPSIKKANELKSNVADRILFLLNGMNNWLTTSKTSSLTNYLTLANYKIHVDIAFQLTHEKLIDRFLPRSWQSWFKKNECDRRENIAKLFNIQEPVKWLFTSKICGEVLDIGIFGPETMANKAWTEDLDGSTHFPFFIEYAIPQVEWHLTNHDPGKHLIYQEDCDGKYIVYRKLI